MIDVAGTAQASTVLTTNTVLTSMGVFAETATEKASWAMQIEMAWALLEPKIQMLFPTRQEVGSYVYREIQKAFYKHHEKAQHSQGYGMGSATIPGFTIVEPGDGPVEVPLYTFTSKMSRPVPIISPISAADVDMLNDIELGAPQVVPIEVYSASPALVLLEA